MLKRKNKIIQSSILLLNFAFIVIGCQSDNRKESSLEIKIKIESVIIDNILKTREGCNYTRVKFLIKLRNLSNDLICIKKNDIKKYCFWRDLKTIFILKNKENITDSLCLSTPEKIVLKPSSNNQFEFVILDKMFVGSINEIDKEISKWLTGNMYFKTTILDKKYLIKTIKNNNYRKIYKLDGEEIKSKDSLNMNKKSTISLEKLIEFSHN